MSTITYYTKPERVKALQIRDIRIKSSDDKELFFDPPHSPLAVGNSWFEKHEPRVDDYYVWRGDGDIYDGVVVGKRRFLEYTVEGDKPPMSPEDLKIGMWLSAALDDPQVCMEFRRDIEAWMGSRSFPSPPGQPPPFSRSPESMAMYREASRKFAAATTLDQDATTARAVHRVIRAMHDGECPKCGGLFPSTAVKFSTRAPGWVCPHCRFSITEEEGQAAIKEFHPFMFKNLEVFEQWRGQRNQPQVQIPGE